MPKHDKLTILYARKRRSMKNKTTDSNLNDINSETDNAINEAFDQVNDVKSRVPDNSLLLSETSPDFIQQLEKDISRFEMKKSTMSSVKEEDDDRGILKSINDILAVVLIGDFFLVIFFLLWFLVAAALQSTYPVILERFQDIFQPIVVPSLTVLMAGSIASGVLGKDNKK
jgi:hypothetical protein